jgi:hypothetical protein
LPPVVDCVQTVSVTINMRRAFVSIASVLLWCAIAVAGGEHAKSVKVTPCRDASRLPPITRRCVAAAIAEDAYLSAAQHQISLHTIYLLSPSSSQWKFVIQEGDEDHPPAEGSEWLIRVNRASGKVEIEAGR